MSRSRHLVDPELLPLVDAFPHIPLSDDTLAAFRARALPAAELSEAARAVGVSHRSIAGPNGAPEVRLAVYHPPNCPAVLPVILHIHGGGFVGGTVEGLEPRHRELAAVLQTCIMSVDYRLAPETKFPGAIEDCYAALAWLTRAADEIGVSADGIVLMGESAGGGLAAALALLARDRGEFQPAFQHLVYPMLDDRTAFDTNPAPSAGEFLWTPDDNRFGWTAILGPSAGGPDVSHYAAPSRAVNLSGLPPAFVMTGALDLFADEGVAYAQRLMRAGVPTELHVYPGAFHGFDLASWTTVGRTARETSLAALARALRPMPGTGA